MHTNKLHNQDKTVAQTRSAQLQPGLAIYAARGLRSGTAEITAVVCTSGFHRLWSLAIFFEKRDANIGHLEYEFGGGSRGAEEECKHAETQIARVERRKVC